jgi:hypothetical protein
MKEIDAAYSYHKALDLAHSFHSSHMAQKFPCFVTSQLIEG